MTVVIESLTCSLHNWSPKLGQDAAEVGMKKALDAWAQHGNLKFIRRAPNTEADILISFHQGHHGDKCAILSHLPPDIYNALSH